MTTTSEPLYTQAQVDAIVAAAVEKAILDERKRAAFIAKNAITNWGEDLLGTADDYVAAIKSGTMAGRKISPEFARQSASQFRARGEAVYDCGEMIEEAIMKAPAAQSAAVAPANG